MKKVIFAAVAVVASAGVAQAKEIVTAKLEAPVAARTKVIAGNSVWTCEGDTCRAYVNRAINARTCGELAREVGRVSAFDASKRSLASEDLARCNTRAPLADTTVATR
jgi:hypothetical protein